VPQVEGVISGALLPILKETSRWEKGNWGFWSKLAVSLPVCGSG